MSTIEEYPDFFEHAPIYTAPKLKLKKVINEDEVITYELEVQVDE